jgi:hypothetical protein
MNDMSNTENMAKGLNIYKSGPRGEAAKAQSGRAHAGTTIKKHSKTTVQLPPLRFTKTKSA